MHMTPEQSFPLIIGAVSGAGASVVQASGPSEWSLVVPVVSAVVGGVFSYAVLKTTVRTIEKDLNLMRGDIGEVHDLIRESAIKIARIEGRLEAQ